MTATTTIQIQRETYERLKKIRDLRRLRSFEVVIQELLEKAGEEMNEQNQDAPAERLEPA